MWHTVLQVLGLVMVLAGAWLVAGVGGVLVSAGLALTVGSVLVEYAGARPAVDTAGGE